LKKSIFYKILEINFLCVRRFQIGKTMSGIDGLCSVLISLVDQLASLYEQDDQRRALLFKGLFVLYPELSVMCSY
jgi:hypothetical protein